MNDEQINIAIAESMDWEWVEGARVRSNSQSGAWCSADGWKNPKTS